MTIQSLKAEIKIIKRKLKSAQLAGRRSDTFFFADRYFLLKRMLEQLSK